MTLTRIPKRAALTNKMHGNLEPDIGNNAMNMTLMITSPFAGI